MIYKHSLSKNIFTESEINSSSLDQFHGRQTEIFKLNSNFSEDGSVSLISGDKGTGRSSLANYIRFSANNVFTPRVILKCQRFIDRHQFIIGLQSVILDEIYYGDAQCAKLKKDKFVQSLYLRNKTILKGYNVAGKYEQELKILIRLITRHLKNDKIIVVLGGLEVRPDFPLSKIVKFIDQISDVLKGSNLNYIIIGTRELYEISFNHKKLKEIFTTKILLDHFSNIDLKKIILQQFKKHTTSSKCRNFIADDVLDLLCEHSSGSVSDLFSELNQLWKFFVDIPLVDYLGFNVVRSFYNAHLSELAKINLDSDKYRILKIIHDFPGISQ